MSAQLSTRPSKIPLLLVDDDALILHEAARQELLSYAFPGKVRELRNIVIRLGAKYPGKQISAAALAGELEADMALAPGKRQTDFDTAAGRQLRTPGFCLDEIKDVGSGATSTRHSSSAIKT